MSGSHCKSTLQVFNTSFHGKFSSENFTRSFHRKLSREVFTGKFDQKETGTEKGNGAGKVGIKGERKGDGKREEKLS